MRSKLISLAMLAVWPGLVWGDPLPEEVASSGMGERAYRRICFVCHDKGIQINGSLGAPRLGDVRAWETRHARGVDALYGRVVEARPERFQMPTGDLTPEEIRAAIVFMLESARR